MQSQIKWRFIIKLTTEIVETSWFQVIVSNTVERQ